VDVIGFVPTLAGCLDTDSDMICNTSDVDDDNDGCSDSAEVESNPAAGGMRNPLWFWDFFDVPTGASLTRDHAVSVTDVFAIIARLNTTGEAGSSPVTTPPPTGYHPAYDRGPTIGTNAWDLGAANGSIAPVDFFALLAQFNHRCH
jgi:hypothetical protein